MHQFGSLLRNAAIVFAGAIVNRLLGYVFRLVVARTGVDEYGIYNLGLTALNLLFVLGSAGLLTGLTRFTAAYVGTNRAADVGRLFTTTIVFSLPLTATVAIFTFIAAPQLAALFGDQRLTPVFRLVAILLPLTMLQEIFLAITDGLKRMSTRVVLVDVVQNAAKIVLVILVFRNAPGAMAAFLALGVSTVVSMVLAGITAGRLAPIRIQMQVDRDLLRYSYPLVFAKFMSTLYGWTDTLVIGLLMTTSDVGLYGAALPTASLLLIPSMCLLSIYLPTVAELAARQEGVSTIYQRVTRWIAVIDLPATIFMIAFAPEILAALFGGAYVGAAPALATASIGFLIQAISKPSGTLLHAYTRTGPVLILSVATVALSLVLSFALIPRLGILGAGISTALTSAVVAATSWWLTRRLAPLNWRELRLGKPLATAFAATLVAKLFSISIAPSLPNVLIAGAAVIATYVAVLAAWGDFDETDRTILRQAAQKLGIESTFRNVRGQDDPADLMP